MLRVPGNRDFPKGSIPAPGDITQQRTACWGRASAKMMDRTQRPESVTSIDSGTIVCNSIDGFPQQPYCGLLGCHQGNKGRADMMCRQTERMVNWKEKNESWHERLPRSLRMERYSGSGQPTCPPSQVILTENSHFPIETFPVAFPPCGGRAFVPFTAAGQRGPCTPLPRFHPLLIYAAVVAPQMRDVNVFNTEKHNI